ncbi:hypothetical protein FKM82_026649 [Ascaphus truei]
MVLQDHLSYLITFRFLNVLNVLARALQSRAVNRKRFHSKFMPQPFTPYTKRSSSRSHRDLETMPRSKWSMEGRSIPASLPESDPSSPSPSFLVSSLTGGRSCWISSFLT